MTQGSAAQGTSTQGLELVLDPAGWRLLQSLPPYEEREALSLGARLRAAGCVYAEQEAALLLGATDVGEALQRLVERRVAGEPLEVVLGWVEFAGLRVTVAPGVFVPRRRSEALAEQAARDADFAAGLDEHVERVLELKSKAGLVECHR